MSSVCLYISELIKCIWSRELLAVRSELPYPRACLSSGRKGVGYYQGFCLSVHNERRRGLPNLSGTYFSPLEQFSGCASGVNEITYTYLLYTQSVNARGGKFRRSGKYESREETTYRKGCIETAVLSGLVDKVSKL